METPHLYVNQYMELDIFKLLRSLFRFSKSNHVSFEKPEWHVLGVYYRFSGPRILVIFSLGFRILW